MNGIAGQFVCHGCGAQVDATLLLPFRCPGAMAGDDVDHVLVPQDAGSAEIIANSDNPYLRYRQFLTTYGLARRVGLSDEAWTEIVERLDEALKVVDGAGFRLTPMTSQPALAGALGLTGTLWVKDETGNVAGSHKARHLMGVMLYLRVIVAARLPVAEGLRHRRLAIASCGNAALAAAVIARAADWPIDVFIPPEASTVVVHRLKGLGATISICERRAGEQGDPCFLRFREAVVAGAIPFGVQGTENGLAIEGGRTLAFEMAEALGRAQVKLDALFVQVGGGALASALAQGFDMAARHGVTKQSPRIFAVQTQACAPLARAWLRIASSHVDELAQARTRYMWPWEDLRASVAHGILDDETYDWLEIVAAMRRDGGQPVVVDEATLERARHEGGRLTGISVSATGTAGLAGLVAAAPVSGQVAVVFSGVDR